MDHAVEFVVGEAVGVAAGVGHRDEVATCVVAVLGEVACGVGGLGDFAVGVVGRAAAAAGRVGDLGEPPCPVVLVAGGLAGGAVGLFDEAVARTQRGTHHGGMGALWVRCAVCRCVVHCLFCSLFVCVYIHGVCPH